MKISSLFTSGLEDPYVRFDFKEVMSEIRNSDGSQAHENLTVVAPAHWSQNAIDIVAKKYFRRAGVPALLKRVPEEGVPSWLWRSVADDEKLQERPHNQRFGRERDVRQVFDRIAGASTYWGWKTGCFSSEADAAAFFNETRYMLAAQIGAPNSPQWFNAGLHWAYGIEGPAQGHWHVDDIGSVRRSTNAYERPQMHSCFIQSVDDDLINPGGVLPLMVDEARIAKYGSGTGANFSRIRGASEALSNGGRACGLVAVLRATDRAAALVTANGSTRRASKMVIVDIDHPDVEEFIDWKVKEEQKVAALVTGSRICARHLSAIIAACVEHEGPGAHDASVNIRLRREIRSARQAHVPENYIRRAIELARQGYETIDFPVLDADWDSEAYLTVAGQNGNNTVRVTDAFLRCLDEDGTWVLTARTDGSPVKSVRARDLWDRIGCAAWSSADPGIHFSTTINEWHTCPASDPILSSNSCSEFLFIDDTGMSLASVNLLNVRKADGQFDIEAFEHACRLWTIALEISVAAAQYPSAEIARRTHDHRPLGLGFANLGGLLMTYGLPYDSDAGRALCGAISAIMSGAAYATSAELAGELGPFAAYPANREAMLRVVRNHRRAAYGERVGYEDLSVLPVALDHATLLSLGDNGKALADGARAAWDRALAFGERHGYRNAQVTVIAPTGTIGLVMDCDTTGIEPDYALVKFKKLAGGGHLKIINRAVPEALRTLGYSPIAIREIVAYAVGHGTLVDAPRINHDTLRRHGFTDEALAAVETALRTAFDIRFAFNKWSLGSEFLTRTLKVPVAKLDDASFDLLTFLGFSRHDIEAANVHVCGAMTLEGAPHLAQAHYAVFDCASPCGRLGKRHLAVESHIRMMAAAQPFISGAISKTINMPHDATVDDCKRSYLLSWQLGLKATALYRDGSKLSQPLNARLINDDVDADDVDDFVQQPTAARVRIVAENVANRIAAAAQQPAAKLPTGKGVKHSAIVAGSRITFRTRNDAEGRPVELSIDTGGTGQSRTSIASDVAVAVSIGLQHGVPLEAFVSAFAAPEFAPRAASIARAGRITASPAISHVFRQLGLDYLGRHEGERSVAV